MQQLCALLIALTLTEIAVAEGCSRQITPISEPRELAYQDRGDRCEGLYAQEVASTGLRILGFHANQLKDLDGPGVALKAALGKGSSLTIESLRRRQYYRLDKTLESGEFQYSFQLIKTNALNIRADEIAARVCVDQCASLRPVLAPVAFGRLSESEIAPFITLQAREELRSLYLKISSPSGAVLFEKNILEGQRQRAWEPIEIPLKRFFVHGGPLLLEATAKGFSPDQVDVVSATLQEWRVGLNRPGSRGGCLV